MSGKKNNIEWKSYDEDSIKKITTNKKAVKVLQDLKFFYDNLDADSKSKFHNKMKIGNACAKILELKGTGLDWDGECYNAFNEFIGRDGKRIQKNRIYIQDGLYGEMSGWNKNDYTFSEKNREFPHQGKSRWIGSETDRISRISGMMELFIVTLEQVWKDCSHNKTK